jgi:hypothetical protein
MKPLALIFVVALLAGPPAAYAGQPATTPDAKPRETSSTAPSPRSAGELPVSIERIRRKLAQAPPSRSKGLKLEYYVEVYGKSPQLDFLAEFNPTAGAVQYGSPTHQEFLDLVTPQEFKSPPADLLSPAMALIKWLAEKGKTKKTDPPR